MVPTPKGPLSRFLELLQRRDSILRCGLCLLAALIMWGGTQGWKPTFSFREGYTPLRDICARVGFEVMDAEATREAKEKARLEIACRYENDSQKFVELRGALIDRVFWVKGDDPKPDKVKDQWPEFLRPLQEGEERTEEEITALKERFIKSLEPDKDLSKLKRAVEVAFLDFSKNGLLQNLEHELGDGSYQKIVVFPRGNPKANHLIDVNEVRIDQVGDQLRDRLQRELRKEFENSEDADFIADRLFIWLRPKLETTLVLSVDETARARELATASVEPVKKVFAVGDRLELRRSIDSTAQGIVGGQRLDDENLQLLKQEHLAAVAQMSLGDMAVYSAATFGCYGSIYLLVGFYLYFRAKDQLDDLRQFAMILGLSVLTVCLVHVLSIDEWRGEMIPIMMFSMMMAIAYQREMALILVSAVSLVSVYSIGMGLSEFVIMVATGATGSFLCGSIRSRTRLVYVGLAAAIVVVPTAIGVKILAGQPLSQDLLVTALWFGFSSIIGGLLMTGLLPFIERSFDIQTDISLLEIGDASHPLLQELVRRAPGTYNHSINVASISEAAAKSIGANGLLCRVGAYFHDIGKMLKPEYFIENQGSDGNRHEGLVPAMSTLVIIAHVKDGVELARQHKLPQKIIDFVEQHHGTTLVEYFFRRAAEQSSEGEVNSPVDEANYRYPGPKPQTKEAGILMLSDAVESASRTLVDPAPARIESLVGEISRKKLEDGQFDDCSLTMKEIHVIEESLVKSLTAQFHGRVKYPNQQSA